MLKKAAHTHDHEMAAIRTIREQMSKTSAPKAQPIAPYLGGKRNLAKRICRIIDENDHEIYAEPFVGMGGNVYNLFRILQEHYVAFLDLLRFQITTQENFNRLVDTNPETLTDLQRAARFLYLQRTAFGGKISGRNFGLSPDRPARFNLTTLEPDLEALHSRLAGVTVTCLNYDEFITRIDRVGAFFYLDPPYFGCENDYGKALFERADFERLAAQLAQIKGRFLMSINDVSEIRATFSAFEISEVQTSYSVAKNAASRGARAELLISNFQL